jgi:hypothetical protein
MWRYKNAILDAIYFANIDTHFLCLNFSFMYGLLHKSLSVLQ